MKITIDEDVCKKYGMTMSELLMILLVKLGVNILELGEQMADVQMIVPHDIIDGKYLVTQRWNDVVESIILDSDKYKQPIDRLDQLVIQLQKIFPEGKKEGTSQYWRGNKREISLRLKKFFKLYDNTYTDDQILTATKNYVEGFNGRYNYMRVLKYFIWKDEKKMTEDEKIQIIEVSDLANYIENADNTNDLKDEWTSTLN